MASGQAIDDPFGDVRGQTWPIGDFESEAKPYDTLDEEEREQFQEEVKELYNTYAPGQPPNKPGIPVLVSGLDRDLWINIIAGAFMCNAEFQRLVADEHTTPGLHKLTSDSLKARPEWLIGLYLPGFYDYFDSFEEGYEKVLRGMLSDPNGDIVGASTNLVQNIIYQVEAERFNTFNENEREQRKHPTSPTGSCIARMATLCQDEKSVNHQRLLTFEHLRGLKKMLDPKNSDLEAGRKLLERYQQIGASDDSLIDRFSRLAVNHIPDFARAVEIDGLATIDTDDDFDQQFLTAIQDAEYTEELQDDAGEDDDEEEDDNEASTSSTGKRLNTVVSRVEGISPDVMDFDEPFGLEEIAKKAKQQLRKKHPAFFYPNWVPPVKGCFYFTNPPPSSSLSQFDSQEGEEPRMDPEGVRLFRSTGFKRARQKSHEAQHMDVDEQVVPDREAILGSCAAYLTDLSQKHRFSEEAFEEMWETLSNLAERPAEVVDESLGSTKFRGFSDLIMRDNWWHVRSLFEAIERYLVRRRPESKARFQTTRSETEMRLAIMVSLIGGGANDPLPWVLGVEGVMRHMWKEIKRFYKKPTPSGLRLLFDELTMWVNGTVVNAYLPRCPLRVVGVRTGAGIVNEWYKVLWDYNPECANQDCVRLLPHPETVDQQYVRGVFSVGIRDVRNGRRAVRSFISSNRLGAYDCLFYVLRYFQPSIRTAVFLFWYAHLYHNARCKSTRGKAAIVPF